MVKLTLFGERVVEILGCPLSVLALSIKDMQELGLVEPSKPLTSEELKSILERHSSSLR